MKSIRQNPFRRIDKFDEGKEIEQPSILSKIEMWEQSWLACANILKDHNGVNIRTYHFLIEKWIPILNKIHNYPIGNFTEYHPAFVYCESPNNLKEIISVYYNSPLNPDKKMVFVFNVPLFRKLHSLYVSSSYRNNRMQSDLDRGIINLSNRNFLNLQPADYYKLSSCWYLLFIAVNHALTHVESYEKYFSTAYDTHEYFRKSSFHKLYLHGRIKYA